MGLNLIGWALAGVLIALGVRVLIQRRKLQAGRMQRCAYCSRPYEGTPVYCPNCGEVLQHGSFRR